jgi:3-oxoacyl-[acyl-carrier protein] reductase
MMLAGKVVIVTGGSRGIGRACVLDAVAQGAHVAFCSRDETDHRRVEEEAAAFGGTDAAMGMAADVADEADVIRLFEIVRERYGAVHGIVNNAAISRERLLVSATTEDWDAVLDTNLTGSFLIARQAIRMFLDQGTGGHMVAIGTLSQFGVTGNANYAVSKAALSGLVRRVARQYTSEGIVSNMVVPGYIETALSANMTTAARRALIDGCPMRRSGRPEEIASVVTFLLSDAARGMHGQTIFASGGLREVPV